MNLKELIADPRTSLTGTALSDAGKLKLEKNLDHLSKYKFWIGNKNQPQLWEHQKAAIGTIAAYLASDISLPERPAHKEAALLKLPTGTGKSGIIAVSARCLPDIKRVLVLTPRTALTDQLLRDIKYRFWGNMGCDVEEGKLFVAKKSEFGAELEQTCIQTLLPSRCSKATSEMEKSKRSVLVGTHQALFDIRKAAYDEENSDTACLALLDHIKENFDLVIVDEGHYEPAVSWSLGVRDFNLPTFLLSATPYRNDFKSFRVRGRFVFNYPYSSALENKIIRPVQFVDPALPPRRRTGSTIQKYVEMLKTELPEKLKSAESWFGDGKKKPRVMVRADDIETLIRLQKLIDREFSTQSVLVHEQARKKQPTSNRFTSVSSAIKARPDAQFWLHQFKLMEGIDDPSFVAIAIFDPMTNARQLIQQIGRATRYSKGDRRFNQVAWIITTNSNLARIRTSWDRYISYEEYVAKNTSLVVTNEVTLPDRLLENMADYQYINGEFREKFEVESPIRSNDIQLPRSAIVLNHTTSLPHFNSLKDVIEESIMDKDRFKITPIEGLPKKTIGFTYYSWRNSPYLVDHFFSEWKLGIFIAVKQGDFVFMQDTGGLINVNKIGFKKASRAYLEKAFPESGDNSITRISRMSFSSLEMSQQAIRSMAIRTRSFEEIFTDLLDPSLVPQSTFGTVNGIGRFIGFTRSRLREDTGKLISVGEFVKWTSSLAKEIGVEESVRSKVFDRYATVIDNLSTEEAQPISILLDPFQDSFLDARDDAADVARAMADNEVILDDLCSDIDEESGEFTINIFGQDVSCSIEYQNLTKKFHLISEQLDELTSDNVAETKDKGLTITQKLNQAQAFRVLVQRAGIVYSEGNFYLPRQRWVTGDGDKPILDYVYSAASLNDLQSEKGEQFYRVSRDEWLRNSIFGLFAATTEGLLQASEIAEDELTREISKFPIWLCDDDSQEIADFIGVDEENKRISFVHAKTGNLAAGGSGYNVSSLQVVGRQALASLAFITRGEPSSKWTAARWTSDIQATGGPLRGQNRMFNCPRELSVEQLNDKLINACKNPAYTKEVWIVGSSMTRRESLVEGLNADEPFNNRLRQFLMHWDSLQTACARASVRLKYYCSE